jgi:hypothetical protein
MQRIAREMNREDVHNPFKIQKNFEGILVDREKDRFIAKLNRDSSLRAGVDEANRFVNNQTKNTPIKQPARKSVTHVNASLLGSLMASDNKPQGGQESLGSLMNNTQAYA